MKLNEFAGGLTKDGILVLNVSNGEITDFLVLEDSARTLVKREKGKLSAYQLKDTDRIVNVNSLSDALKVLKT
jgi:hemolysin activation/secretion protein